jgi:hypothetical protein
MQQQIIQAPRRELYVPQHVRDGSALDLSRIGRNVRLGRNVRTGRSAGSATATDPLGLISSVPPVFFVSADVGTTIATGVSDWTDQSGNGNSFAQATAANQPALVTADADFGGRNSLLGDGVNDYMTNVWVPPAPNVTPSWFFLVFRQVTWTAGKYIFAASTSSAIISFAQSGVTPALSMLNTSNVNNNTGAAIGASVRGEVHFNGATTDYTKCAATLVTGASAAVSAGLVGLKLFSRNNGTTAQTINAKIACIGAWEGLPSLGERAALDAWVTDYYGGSVAV